MAESLAIVEDIPVRMQLHLDITDAEVIAEIRARPEGADRTAYALGALRIGVLAMRTASGQVDAAAIREAGAALISELREVMAERAAELAGSMKTELARHLDPKTGTLPQRLDRLVSKGGEIERCMTAQIAPENSVLSEMLVQKIGRDSPIFRMLSPDDSRGIKAQLEATIRAALEQQQRTLLEEFSLDSPHSALSRLVGRVEDVQKTVAGHFSMDNEASALRRMMKLLDETSEQIQGNLTLDREDSALSRLGRELQTKIDAIVKVNTQVLEAVASLHAKKTADARTTGHGKPFEDQLGQVLARHAQQCGDAHEATGMTTGSIRLSKVGDFVTELGSESAAAGARIVWEAKANASFDLKKARAELETARKNRDAQLGVFVWSREAAPEGQPCFERHGSDLFIVWDHEDAASDLFVQAAWTFARAWLVREAGGKRAVSRSAVEMTAALREIEKQLPFFEEIRKLAQTVAGNGTKIVERATKMALELELRLETLDEHVRGLNAGE